MLWLYKAKPKVQSKFGICTIMLIYWEYILAKPHKFQFTETQPLEAWVMVDGKQL